MSSYMKILAPNSLLNCVPQTLWRPLVSVVDGEHLQPRMMQSSSRLSFMKNLYHLFPIPNSILRFHSSGSLQFSSSQIGQHLQQQVGRGSPEDQSPDKDILVDSAPESSENLGHEDCKEVLRRRKISIANKGKKPWNKGIPHTPEVREKIKQRIIEALRDPKVRKKMSDPRPTQSEEWKARISISQKLAWRKRLKLKRIKEKLYLRWEECIAEAARIGWPDQQELDWDSYEMQIQHAAEKVRAKKIENLRTAGSAKDKEEKMAELAQRREEREQRAKARGEIKRKTRKLTVEEEQQLAISKDLRFREKITEIRQKAHQRRMLKRQLDILEGR